MPIARVYSHACGAQLACARNSRTHADYEVEEESLDRTHFSLWQTDPVNSVKVAVSSNNNPAFKGWAFELEQLDFIRLSLESPPENPLLVTNDSGLSFYPCSPSTFDEK